MQTSVFFHFSYRLFSRYPSTFIGAVGIGVFCCILATMSILYSVYSSSSVRYNARHIAFVLSMEAEDSKTSLKILRSHQLIDSVAIVSSTESRLLIEDIVGTSLDSIELNATLPTVMAVFPSMRCSSAADFASITELCERLPLTDNIVRDIRMEQSYISHRRTHHQMVFVLSTILGLVMMTVTMMYSQNISSKVAHDASIFYRSGASPLFSSLPWMMMTMVGMVVGIFFSAGILGAVLVSVDGFSSIVMTEGIEIALVLSVVFSAIAFMLVPLRLWIAAIQSSGNREE